MIPDHLLAAVLGRPGDDTPRLLCADWLDEFAGDLPDPGAARRRAEFIRVGCELARMPRLVPANVLCHRVEWEHLASQLPSGENVRFDPPAPGSSSGVGVLHYETPNPARRGLEKREVELWGSWPDEGDIRSGFHDEMARLTGQEWVVLPGAEADVVQSNRMAVVRRGFISELRLPLAAFVGGECGRCYGDGIVNVVHPGYGDPCPACPCPACKGTGDARGHRLTHSFERCQGCRGVGATGRTPGLDLAAIWSVHPITAVRFADAEFTRVAHSDTVVVYDDRHFTTGGGRYRDVIPGELFARLTGGQWANTAGSCREYASADLALSALSDAAVALSRAAAGLTGTAATAAS